MLTPLTKEQSDLAATGWPAALAKCRIMAVRYRLDERDLRGIAAESLLVAARKFRPDMGASFITYAKHCVTGAIKTHGVRDRNGLTDRGGQRQGANYVSRSDASSRGMKLTSIDLLMEKDREPPSLAPSPEQEVSDAEFRGKIVRTAKERCTAPRHKNAGVRWWEAVRMRYIDEMELTEIAAVLGPKGMTFSNVSHIIRQGLRVMAGSEELQELAA